MKKGLFLLILTAFTTVAMISCQKTASAQIIMYRNTDTTSSGVATTATITTGTTDTLYDANTLYSFYTKVGALNNTTADNYAISFEVVKISGTGTARVYLQASMNGTSWVNINSGMIGTDGRNTDTLNIAAAGVTATSYSYSSVNGAGVYRPATNDGTFYVNSQRWLYLRLKIVGTGTQATIYKNVKLYTF